MSERSRFDEFRDLAEGRFDAASAARLRAAAQADPALAAEMALYAQAHALTAPAAPGFAPPASTLGYEELAAARRAGRIRRIRPWAAAAAAALLVAAGVAAFVPRGPRTVTLRSISLAAATASPAPAEDLPPSLATYRPVDEESIRWIDSIETGRAVARWSGRRVLLWIMHPGCPTCVEWNQGMLRREDVLAFASEFVPVRLDVMKIVEEGREEFKELYQQGWPYVGIQEASGKRIVDAPGERPAEELLDELSAGRTEDASLPWPKVNELAGALARAREAASKDAGTAWKLFDAVRRDDPDGALGRAAEAGLRALAHDAATALEEAKTLAGTDEGSGARRLSEAAERFRGTPYGTDLAEVEQELRATGRFPILVEAPPTTH